jgi:hypothetical protein
VNLCTLITKRIHLSIFMSRALSMVGVQDQIQNAYMKELCHVDSYIQCYCRRMEPGIDPTTRRYVRATERGCNAILHQ